MRKLLILMICSALCAGCATTKQEGKPAATKQPKPPPERRRKAITKPEPPSFSYRLSASRRLSKAVDLLEEGDVAGATKLLHAICSGHSVPGVTDEALFRLALLTLKPAAERPVSKQGAHLLRRLREEYPSSPWAIQASQLTELVNVDEELRHQNRSLKNSNQSLTKKINELNDTIDQLKNLDLELEKKNH